MSHLIQPPPTAIPAISDDSMSGSPVPDVSLAAVNTTIARLNNKIQYLGTMVNQVHNHAIVLRTQNENLLDQMFETRLDIERVSNRVNDDELGVDGHMEDIREEIAERRRIHRPRELYGMLPVGWRRSGEFKLLEGTSPAIVPPFIPTSSIFYVVTKGRVPGIYSDGEWVKHLQGGLDYYKKRCIETEDLWQALELWDDALHTLQIIGRNTRRRGKIRSEWFPYLLSPPPSATTSMSLTPSHTPSVPLSYLRHSVPFALRRLRLIRPRSPVTPSSPSVPLRPSSPPRSYSLRHSVLTSSSPPQSSAVLLRPPVLSVLLRHSLPPPRHLVTPSSAFNSRVPPTSLLPLSLRSSTLSSLSVFHVSSRGKLRSSLRHSVLPPSSPSLRLSVLPPRQLSSLSHLPPPSLLHPPRQLSRLSHLPPPPSLRHSVLRPPSLRLSVLPLSLRPPSVLSILPPPRQLLRHSVLRPPSSPSSLRHSLLPPSPRPPSSASTLASLPPPSSLCHFVLHPPSSPSPR
ncbi:hypothetical protein DFP72DRAFT_1086682 [Ephemerocybe angulata]|uniref:Uncharacterized protein n=1 Tax=Ephemerocybe angulata TaxID=980116 RepID=A0A8H6H7U5_9AGAR|nr:hypothetical protein DFP72DRAFT_1086682 [Tulosesus angulatus]